MDYNPLYPTPTLGEDNAEGSARLAKWLNTPGALAPEYTAADRLAYGAMTAIPKAVEGLSSAVGNIGDFVTGTTPPEPHTFLPESAYLPPGITMPQKAADIAAGIMPIAGEIAVTGGIGRGINAISGLSRVPLAARMFTNALEFGTVGAGENVTVGAEQAGEGAVMGAITNLLPKSSPLRWALAAGLGFASKSFFDAHDPNASAPGPSRGDLSGIIQTAATIGLGKPLKNPFHFSGMPGEIPTRTAEIPTRAEGPMNAPNAPRGFPQSNVARYNQVTTAGPAPVPLPAKRPIIPDPIVYGPPIESPVDWRHQLPLPPDPVPYVQPEPVRTHTEIGSGIRPPDGRIPFTPSEINFPEQPLSYSSEPLMPVNDWRYQQPLPPEPVPYTQPVPVQTHTEIGRGIRPPESIMPGDFGPMPIVPEPAPLTYTKEPLMPVRDWRHEGRPQQQQFATSANPMMPDTEVKGPSTAPAPVAPVAPIETVARNSLNPNEAPPAAGISNTTATWEKNIADARMMHPGDDKAAAAFLRKYNLNEAADKIDPPSPSSSPSETDELQRLQNLLKQPEPEPAPVAVGNPMMPSKPKRSKDFKTTGNYEVTVGDHKYQMFKDPDDTNWYLNKQDKDGRYMLLGTNTQKEAVANLGKRVNEGRIGPEHSLNPPAVEAASAPVAPKKDSPIIKLARSNSMGTPELETELRHYSEEERKVIAELEGFSDHSEPALAQSLKEKYGLSKDTSGASYSSSSANKESPSLSRVLRDNRPENIGATSAINEATGMKKRVSGEAGSTLADMQLALGRAFVGGLTGGVIGAVTDDKGEHSGMVTGLVSGALVGFFGPSMLRSAIREVKETPSSYVRPLDQIDRSTTVGTPKRNMGELIAQAHLNMRTEFPSFADKALTRMDDWFGLSMGPKFRRVIEQSGGPARYFSNNIDRAMRKISFIHADADMMKFTNDFLEGGDKGEYLSKMGPNPDRKAYADFAISARENMDGLMEIASRGQGNAGRTQMMLDTRGEYLRRSFRMFTQTGYKASEESINKLAQKISNENLWGNDISMDQIQKGLRQWAEDIKLEKGIYAPKEGSKIDQTLFRHRKLLDKETREFLGEITNPVDRVRLTTLKLQPAAKASNFMHTVVTGLTKSDEGLPLSFASFPEVQASIQKLEQDLKATPNDPALRKQMLELAQYKYVSADPANGELQGRYVHRLVEEVMTGWGSQMEANSAMSRTMLGINRFMKSNVTYRNPMSIVRQVVSAPFFMTIGRGWSHTGLAWDVMWHPNHPLNRELIENGITHVDQITREVLREADTMSGGLASVPSEDGIKAYLGRVDSKLGDFAMGAKYVDSKMANGFKFADTMVRVSTYLAAKSRIAQELGAAMDSTEVVNRAVEFTNRYTMNYNMLPKAVLKGREVPFMNLFISYAAEMARITKNLGVDVIKGDTASRLNAVIALGTAVVMPEVMQRVSESSLSDRDKKDWAKVKAGLPVYMKDRYMVVTGREPNGKFRYYDFNNWLPMESFQQTIRAVSEGRVLDAAKNNPVMSGDNNPFLNVTASIVTGEDRFTGRKLRGPTDYIASGAKEVLGPLTPGVGSQWRNAELALTGATDKRGKSVSALDFWLPVLSSIKAGNLDLSVIQQNAVSDYKSNVANEMAYYNDIVKMQGIDPVQKQRAAERTKLALRKLSEQLSAKLGTTPPYSQ